MPSNDRSIRLHFPGAAGTVTGSKTLVESTSGSRVLVDCGLLQGLKKLRKRNWDSFPVPPESIDHVILTHGHLDHTGYLPRLVKLGYRGPIHATQPTGDITEIILKDSAKIQEEEAERAGNAPIRSREDVIPNVPNGVTDLSEMQRVPM